MKTAALLLLTVIAFAANGGFAAKEGNSSTGTKSSVRLRFAPSGPPAKGSSDFKGASWTSLAQGPQKDVLWCQAHAGVGDEFPVMKDAVKLFSVLLLKGDDDRITLEVRSKEGRKTLDLRRDTGRQLEIEGTTYEFLYPSVSVSADPGEKPTTNKVMLLVKRRL